MSLVAPAPAAPSRPRRAAPATETAPKRRQNRRRPATLARPREGRSPVAPGVLWVLLIATLLGGIVALNVGALRNSISASKIEGQEAALRSQNDALRSIVGPAIGLGSHQRLRGLHVDVAALVDLEALAYRFYAAERFEQRAQIRGIDAEHLDVDVLRLVTEEMIANPAADNKCAATCALHGAGNLYRSCIHQGSSALIGSRPHRLVSRSQNPGAMALSTASPFEMRCG